MESAVKGLLIAVDATKRQEFIRRLDAQTIASMLASRDEEVTKIIVDILDVEKMKQVVEAVVTEAATRVSVTNNAVTTTTTQESGEEAEGAQAKSNTQKNEQDGTREQSNGEVKATGRAWIDHFSCELIATASIIKCRGQRNVSWQKQQVHITTTKPRKLTSRVL